MESKKQYDLLLKQGSLLELYENMTGIWAEDRDLFQSFWELEQFYITNTEITDYDEY